VNHDLISAEEFDNLPDDPEQCFVEFEATCRRNMNKMCEGEQDREYCLLVEKQYMFAVYAVAQECGVASLPEPDIRSNNHYESFNQFLLNAQSEVARIRVRGRRSLNSLSVQLRENTRTKIQHYVLRLREIIDKSTLPNHRKTVLHGKLNELMAELEKRRLNFGKTMLMLSVVLSGLGAASNATTIAAEGQAAVGHILGLIGTDKESEQAAVSRLAPPQKALPAPEKKPMPRSMKTDLLDDDIPF
jgi:hypothetical protein